MNAAIVTQHVPQADPVFVEILGRLPDPPTENREALLKLLPELHRQFLEKRRAFQEDDGKAWNAVMEDQLRLIQNLDRF